MVTSPEAAPGARYLPPERVLGQLVTEEEQAAVEEAVEQIAVAVGVPGKLRRACHYMVYGHQAEAREGEGACAPSASSSAAPPARAPGDEAVLTVRRFSELLVERLLGSDGDGRGCSRIVSIRVLFAPPDCEPQSFHLDYGQAFEAVDTVFVALTSVAADNCTEVLQWQSPGDAAAALDYARRLGGCVDGRDLLSHISACRGAQAGACIAGDAPLARVAPLESARWGVWVVPTSHCFHRRGPTLHGEGGAVRVTLNIDVARATGSLGGALADPAVGPGSGSCAQGSGECATASTSEGSSSSRTDEEGEETAALRRFEASLAAFVCVDTQRALQTGRVCGQESVDDLSEQDIYLHGDLGQIVAGCQRGAF